MNKSFQDHIEIKKRQLLGFLVVEPENLEFQHVPQKKKAKKEKKGRVSKTKKADRRLFELLDFAYAGREVVNQEGKVAPGVIKGATNDINNIVK